MEVKSFLTALKRQHQIPPNNVHFSSGSGPEAVKFWGVGVRGLSPEPLNPLKGPSPLIKVLNPPTPPKKKKKASTLNKMHTGLSFGFFGCFRALGLGF